MTLRLSDAQTEALRRTAAAEHRSMQQVAVAGAMLYSDFARSIGGTI